jgi:hypothetical protein
MKIKVTITKEELSNTKSTIWVDPCTHILCGQIEDCEQCPLRETAEALRTAQNKFISALNEIEVENEKAD